MLNHLWAGVMQIIQNSDIILAEASAQEKTECKDWPNSIPCWNNPAGKARAEGTHLEPRKMNACSYSAMDFLWAPNKAIFTLCVSICQAVEQTAFANSVETR